MGVLVVGSVALDSVKTPFGAVEEVLGGSASYFSTAASFFTEVSLVGVVGDDFPSEALGLFREREINIDGLERVRGKTFRWKGEYSYDLNEAITLDTQLNAFEHFRPKLPPSYRESPYVFLANIDPELQLEVLTQVKRPKFVACDTMNFWIQGKLDALKAVLRRVDLLTINEGEARQLAQEPNVVKAARAILRMGPKALIVKRGEYGALMFNGSTMFFAPAYPLEAVYDPTGAGDSFAGGFMGYLANVDAVSEEAMRQAIIMGSTMASFNVESFSLERLRSLTYPDIRERFRAFRGLVNFADLPEAT
ncbi:MAG TPA: PfkB family carbohydrate kinase [Candidatus Tectomicrobia bacterium]|nr:PfkB family carbohydrate kinase [Candidatus Tectomicrobia bacterium]